MIKPIKKPNAAIAKMVSGVTGGKRVVRGMSAPMDKHGVKSNIPVMTNNKKPAYNDRTGSMTGGYSYLNRPKGSN